MSVDLLFKPPLHSLFLRSLETDKMYQLNLFFLVPFPRFEPDMLLEIISATTGVEGFASKARG